MSRLDSVIRLHRWQLDEKRRRLVELETMADETRRRIAALERELAEEARLAHSGPTGLASWHAYAESVRERRQKLEVTLGTIESEAEETNREIAEAFQELKKFELISDARVRRVRETAARREQSALDEVALSNFRRSSAV